MKKLTIKKTFTSKKSTSKKGKAHREPKPSKQPPAADPADVAPVATSGPDQEPPTAPPAIGRAPGATDPRMPPVGTVIIKSDRHGKERVRCVVVDGGVEYGGKVYKTLTGAGAAAAADLGLGTTVNGYIWWGVTKPERTMPKKSQLEALTNAWDRYRERAQAISAGAIGAERVAIHAAISQQAAALRELATGTAPTT